MTSSLRRILAVLFMVAVAAVLSYGAAAAFGTRSFEACGDDIGEIGTCPPFNQQGCQSACQQQFGGGGGCNYFYDEPCCVCQV